MENFLTINENIESEITVKKSKFICNLIKIETQEEAEEQIKKIKKKYHDARHNCVAYRVQENDTIVEKASDDGEPSGTAGGPMLTEFIKCISNSYKIFWRNFIRDWRTSKSLFRFNAKCFRTNRESRKMHRNRI